MNKDEFLKICLERTTLDKDEISTTFDESLQYCLDRGLEGEEAETIASKRAASILKRHLTSDAEKFEGFVLFVGQPTDYGATKRYETVSAEWKAADEVTREDMIDSGKVDAEGTPLWVKPGNKKHGKKIQLNRYQRTVYMVAKRPEDKDYTKTRLTLWPDKCDLETPVGKKVAFRAKVGQQQGDFLSLSSANVTEFTPMGDETCNVAEALKEFFADNYVDFKSESFNKWVEDHTQSGSNYSNTFVVTKANVLQVNVTGDDKSVNVLTITADESVDDLFSDELTATCWLPKSIPVNFAEGATDVTVIGQVSTGEEGKVFINVESLEVEAKDVITEKAEAITPDKEVVSEEAEPKAELEQNLSM